MLGLYQVTESHVHLLNKHLHLRVMRQILEEPLTLVEPYMNIKLVQIMPLFSNKQAIIEKRSFGKTKNIIKFVRN